MSHFPGLNVERSGNNLLGKVGLSRKLCQAKYALASAFSRLFKKRMESSIRDCVISDSFFA